MVVSNKNLLCQGSSFRGYVSSQECIILDVALESESYISLGSPFADINYMIRRKAIRCILPQQKKGLYHSTRKKEKQQTQKTKTLVNLEKSLLKNLRSSFLTDP